MSDPSPLDNDARTAQASATLRVLQNKKPMPEIDFTIHTLDDGTTASTVERYHKGLSTGSSFFFTTPLRVRLCFPTRLPASLLASLRGS